MEPKNHTLKIEKYILREAIKTEKKRGFGNFLISVVILIQHTT